METKKTFEKSIKTPPKTYKPEPPKPQQPKKKGKD
jgi:hypothetical protein